MQNLLRSEIRIETDVVSVRRKARDIARVLGFDNLEQTRIATAVSEVARNAFEYAKGGTVEYRVIDENQIKFVIMIQDKGKGIQNLKEIENGTYVSPQGMGLGLMGARKLMDQVLIDTNSDGTTVTLKKILPGRKNLLSPKELKEIHELILSFDNNPMTEIIRQNQEILLAMDKLSEKKEELLQINQELEDTNRGVVALYAELDEKAEILRKANDTKTSFLSDLTHEFRSPLNSILGIAQILIMEAKQEKALEREKQVNFIVKAAKGLSDLVNDLLDIAKIEAGKITVKVSEFSTVDLFSSLRGLMRPVGGNENVSLHFELNHEGDLKTDEGKLTQILRNLISNSLKYTLEGEVTVYASKLPSGEMEFLVKDTGIGIPEELQESIFEEFFQVEHEHQTTNKGTGLGLPLSRKLAHLLGGTLTVESKTGVGSTFKLIIPSVFSESLTYNEKHSVQTSVSTPNKKMSKTRILVVDDDDSVRYQVLRLIKDLGYDAREAINGRDALEIAKVYLPDLIVLDLVMPEKDGMEFIREAMEVRSLRDTPILLHSSKDLEAEERLYFEQVTKGIIPKGEMALETIKDYMIKILGQSDGN